MYPREEELGDAIIVNKMRAELCQQSSAIGPQLLNQNYGKIDGLPDGTLHNRVKLALHQ